MAVHTQAIQKLYLAYFNRPADYEGLAHWEKVLNLGNGNLELVSRTFAQSQEFKTLTQGQTHEQIINRIYTNLFNREAEPGGMAFWAARLREGTFTVDQIVKIIADSASDTEAKDRSTYTNKVTAATAFTADLDLAREVLGYSSNGANILAGTWLSTIGDAASLEYALKPENLEETVRIITESGIIPQPPKLLTKGVDTLQGTWSNDVFQGTVSSDPVFNTLDVQDTINGAGGADTLRILGESGALSLPKLNGVEYVSLTNRSSTGELVLKLVASQGIESISGYGTGRLSVDLSSHEGAILRVAGGEGADTLAASMGVNARADELSGGLGDDVLIAGSNSARLTGGLGKDQFVLAPTSAGFGSKFASTYSTVKDFTAEDLLQLKWFNGAAVASVSGFARLGVSLDDSTAVFSNYVDAAITQARAGEAVWFSYQGNAYVVVDSGAESTAAFAAGQDLIVQLTGADLTEVSFNAQYGTIALA